MKFPMLAKVSFNGVQINDDFFPLPPEVFSGGFDFFDRLGLPRLKTRSLVLVANMRRTAVRIVPLDGNRILSKKEQWKIIEQNFPLGSKMNTETHVFDSCTFVRTVRTAHGDNRGSVCECSHVLEAGDASSAKEKPGVLADSGFEGTGTPADVPTESALSQPGFESMATPADAPTESTLSQPGFESMATPANVPTVPAAGRACFMAALPVEISEGIAKIGVVLAGNISRVARIDTAENMVFRKHAAATNEPTLIFLPQCNGVRILSVLDGLPDCAHYISNNSAHREGEFARFLASLKTPPSNIIYESEIESFEWLSKYSAFCRENTPGN